MKAIVTTDLHLTDRKEDRYRWRIFDTIHKKVSRDPSLRRLFILGDLTDRKDHHSAWLVNTVAAQLRTFETAGVKVVLLKGNHDYHTNPDQPFFDFLRWTGITVVVHELEATIDGKQCLFVGHNDDPKYWKDNRQRFRQYDYLFMHQTVNKAVASNGHALPGISSRFKGPRVFSGDIHVPQQVGEVVYIGSPHPVHQGDSFSPRYMLLNFKTGREIYKATNTIHKPVLEVSSVEELQQHELHKNDQVRVRMRLSRDEASQWPDIRDRVQKHLRTLGCSIKGVEIVADKGVKRRSLEKNKRFGVSSNKQQVLKRFCKAQNVDETTKDIGMEVFNAVNK